jgi:aryl-alcohol dehydrogenase-like predicted oxidoreductase
LHQNPETDAVTKRFYGATEDADRKVVEAVAQIAERRGVPRAHVAMAWVAQKPGVTAPIIGATKAQHLDDALAALSLELTPDEVAALEEPYVPHAVVGLN